MRASSASYTAASIGFGFEPVLLAERGDEGVGERAGCPRAARAAPGTADREHVEAEEEVLAEAAVARPRCARSLLVAASTRTSTWITCSLPTRDDLAVLQRAQHLGLRGEVHVADLVEEERAAVGLLEEAALARLGAGERAALVAEELALDQLARDRGAVDLDERRVLARAEAGGWRG